MLKGGTWSACAIAGTAVLRMVVSKDSMKKPTATSQGSSRLAVAVSAMSSVCTTRVRRRLSARERGVDDGLRLADQPTQMRFVIKAFAVDFVDVFGAGGACGKPATARGYFDAADRRIVAGCSSQDLFDRISGKFLDVNLLRIEHSELGFLCGVRSCIDPIGKGGAQFLRECAILLARVTSGTRRDFRRQQCGHDAVLFRRPRPTVNTAERRAGAFLAAETQFSIHEPGDEPLEAHRHFVHGALQALAHPIDHRAAHHRLTDGGVRAPAAA